MKTTLLSILIFFTSITVNAQFFKNYTTANGLPSNNVLCLDTDASGNIWFGTQKGIAKFDGICGFSYYTDSSHTGLADNMITAIKVVANGDVWVGTDNGVSIFNGTTFTTYTTSDGLGNNRIKHIDQAANGDIWLGEYSGATKYSGGSFTSFGTSDGIPFGGINYIAFDSKDEVYLASGLAGYIHYNGSVFTTYNESNGLVSNVVRAIAIDSLNNKWVGTAKGITVFDSLNVKVTNYTKMLIMPAPDTLNPVVDIKINSFGEVWAGIYVDYLVTVGGIVHYLNTSWDDYTDNDGLVGPVVKRITIDTNENVWIATSTGVTKMSQVADPNNFSTPSISTVVTDASETGSSDGSIATTVNGGATPYVYTWSNSATTESLVNITTGAYGLTVTDYNGCNNVSSANIDAPSSLSNNDLTTNAFAVFPNPTSNTLNIALNTANKVSIYNLLGDIMYVSSNYSSVQLDISSWAKGIYFVKSDNQVEKLVIR